MDAHELLKDTVNREKAIEQMKKGISLFIDAFWKAYRCKQKGDIEDKDIVDFAFYLASQKYKETI